MPRPGSGSTKTTVSGTRGDDTISVGSGGVTINGTFKAVDQAKIDAGLIIKGSDGNDTLSGGPGIDTLDGGKGDDTLRDTIDTTFIGGLGTDTVDLSGSSTAVAIDLQGSGTVFQNSTVSDPGNGYLQAVLGSAVNGTLQGIENAIGSAGNDWIMGSSAANVLHGGGGDDIISAVQNDRLADQLFGDDGNDNLYAGSGNDQLTGGVGNDTFTFDPSGSDGHWIVTDYTPGEDRVVLYPYSGQVAWGTDASSGWVQATVGNGDTITFVGVTDWTEIVLIETTAWPPL